jgi:hypothetical protein
MKELLRTNDLVLLSWAQAMLADAGIESVVFDQYVSAIEGSAGPVARRIMVGDDDFHRAQWIMDTERPGVAP